MYNTKSGELKEALFDQYKKYLGVTVIPTYKCNFHCTTCCETLTNDPSRIHQILNLDDLEAFIQFLIKVNDSRKEKEQKFKWILLSGGECTTLDVEYLKKIANLVHQYDFLISMATNGSNKEKLLELDEHFDRFVISHHGKSALMPEWIDRFKHASILVSKLIDVNSFPNRESFERFVEEIIQDPREVTYRQKFITYGRYTPGFEKVHPKWVDSDFPTENVVWFTTPARKADYRGFEVRMTHFNPTEKDIKGQNAELPHTWIMHPNGVVNTHWGDDESDSLDYRLLNSMNTSTKNLPNLLIVKEKMQQLSAKFAKEQKDKYGLDPTQAKVIY